MTACMFLMALEWRVLPWMRAAWVRREEGAGTSLVVPVLRDEKALAHAGGPGVRAGEAVRGEAGASDEEKRGGKLDFHL